MAASPGSTLMGLKVVTVRGRRIAVEARTDHQLKFLKNHLERRTDTQLDEYAADTRRLHEKYPERGIE